MLNVPAGKYELAYGILQCGFREVTHGAPGAAGPVMNHFKREITRAYLNRLNKISEDTADLFQNSSVPCFATALNLAVPTGPTGSGNCFLKHTITFWSPGFLLFFTIPTPAILKRTTIRNLLTS